MTASRMSQVIVPRAFTHLSANADKRTVITALTDCLCRAKKIASGEAQVVVEEAMRREAIGSTGIGHGIAIPHCRTPLVSEIMCAYGQSAGGLDFDSLDGEPVHSVFLLLTPPDQKDAHLALMKSFASQIRKDNFCAFLHQVKTAQSLIELLAEFEGT
jgi:mannitol/fructose-specific phosphotransferase system IIA component (Ntr-type)